MKECHVRHVTYVTREVEKIQEDFNCFCFSKWKKEQRLSFDFNQMLLFLETIMASCANVPATTVSFFLWQRLSESSAFTLKTPRSVSGHCHAKH